MYDLSLHLLDLMENALRAGASVVAVSLVEDTPRDLLEVMVDDNGCGLEVTPEAATDPFYTTKQDKPTGLGLSLMKAAAERAGGTLTLSRSDLGGLRMAATLRLSHVDRLPMGDLAASFASVAFTHPELDLRVRFASDGRAALARLFEPGLEPSTQRCVERASRFADEIREGAKLLRSQTNATITMTH